MKMEKQIVDSTERNGIEADHGFIDPYNGDITREGWGGLTYVPII